MGERDRVHISAVELAELSANLLPEARNPPKQRRSSNESPASNGWVWRQGLFEEAPRLATNRQSLS